MLRRLVLCVMERYHAGGGIVRNSAEINRDIQMMLIFISIMGLMCLKPIFYTLFHHQQQPKLLTHADAVMSMYSFCRNQGLSLSHLVNLFLEQLIVPVLTTNEWNDDG